MLSVTEYLTAHAQPGQRERPTGVQLQLCRQTFATTHSQRSSHEQFWVWRDQRESLHLEVLFMRLPASFIDLFERSA